MSDNPFGAKLKKVGAASGKDSPAPEPKEDKPPKSPFLKSEGEKKSPFLSSAGDDKPPKSPFLKREESPSPGLKSPFLSKSEVPSKASVTSAAESSPFGQRKSQRQSLEASGKDSPAAGRESADLEKSFASMAKTEGSVQPPISRKESAASVHSAAPSVRSQGPAVSRQGSVHSVNASMQQSPEIAIEEALSEHGSQAPSRQPSIHSVASGRPMSVHSAAHSNFDLTNENQKLKAQIESLQRLMASGNQDTKIHRLQEDLNERALKVKELERELKKSKDDNTKLKADLDKAKKAKKGKDIHDTPTPTHHDSKIIAEKDGEIEELHRQIAMLQDAAQRGDVPEVERMVSRATTHSDGPSPPKGRTSDVRMEVRYDQGAIQEVKSLKQALTERDAVIQQLNLKLERAQEAILSSAGVGWEAHVKLHQTKGMLGKMLRAASPDGERQKSVSMPRGESQPRGPVVNFKAAEDEIGKLRLFKYVDGEKSLVCNLRYANGAVYDQTGAVMPLGEKGRDDLPRLAALADMCNIPHNIPESEPVVVVAGHNIASPSPPRSATAGSPYSARAGSTRAGSPTYNSPIGSASTSRYRSPTRRAH